MAQPKTETVWITRTLPQARKTALLVKAMGFKPLLAPVLAVKPLSPDMPDQDYRALIFTSVNAVSRFAKLSPVRQINAFCVGEATAKSAKSKGFRKLYCAHGDDKALLSLIASTAIKGDKLLWCAPKSAAQPLDLWLNEAGFPTYKLDLYDTVPVIPHLSRKIISQPVTILLHSAKAAQQVGHLINDPANGFIRTNLTFICLSQSIANSLSLTLKASDPCDPSLAATNMTSKSIDVTPYRLKIAARPTQTDLLALLQT